MARRYFNALEDKIQKTRARVEMGIATVEEIEWLRKAEVMRQPKPKGVINLNLLLGEEEHPKRRKLGVAPVSAIQRYRHPYSRRSTK